MSAREHTLFLDFETRSRADLRKVGAYRYAEDPSTEVVVAGWALDDDLVVRWTPADDQAELLNPLGPPHMTPSLDDWKRYVQHPDIIIVAHNAEFERLILIHKCGVTGAAAEPSRFRCTAAQSARAGLPRGLEKAAEAAGLASWDKKRKDRIIRKLSQPRRATGEWWEREDAEEEWDELEGDCVQDVETCRALYRMLPAITAQEQAVWELTVRMNDRGMKVDLEAVHRAKLLAEEEQARVAARFEQLVGAAPGSPKARKLLGVPSLNKSAVRHMLRDPHIDPKLREALLLRKRWARSSLAKLEALQLRTSADGRLRGSLTYAGAERTARWSSHGVQWHNAPRGLGKGTDLAFEALRTGAMRACYEDPLLTISDMLKGFLVGPFLVGDYGQIEARDLAWQAGQDDLLSEFEANVDVYCTMASSIYGHEVGKFDETNDPKDYDPTIHMPKRQLGKVAVLGCGYGLGAEGLRRQLDEVFDVVVDEDMADRVVRSYRRSYPRIPAFWRLLEQGFAFAVSHSSRRIRVGPVLMGTIERGGRRWAYIELPSGRLMYYFDPKVERDGQVTYLGRNRFHGGRWERVRTYGGMLAENVVQATARDVLVEAMLKLDGAGFKLVLTVHDEVVSEDEGKHLAQFTGLMTQRPVWATALPLVVESIACGRYRK